MNKSSINVYTNICIHIHKTYMPTASGSGHRAAQTVQINQNHTLSRPQSLYQDGCRLTDELVESHRTRRNV
jgi:hypothetical protein